MGEGGIPTSCGKRHYHCFAISLSMFGQKGSRDGGLELNRCVCSKIRLKLSLRQLMELAN